MFQFGHGARQTPKPRDRRLRMGHMALKSVEARANEGNARLKPEEQELARKQEEQAALQVDLADRELRLANLLAELGAFEARAICIS